jgi:hypothetical protein
MSTCLFKHMCVLLMCMFPIHLICIFLFFSFFGIWEKNLYKCCVTYFLFPMYVLLYGRSNIMQQVKARYIYILGVKRLDFIIKSWITRKLLSFSQSGRLESPKSRLLIFKWQDRLTNTSFLNFYVQLEVFWK